MDVSRKRNVFHCSKREACAALCRWGTWAADRLLDVWFGEGSMLTTYRPGSPAARRITARQWCAYFQLVQSQTAACFISHALSTMTVL